MKRFVSMVAAAALGVAVLAPVVHAGGVCLQFSGGTCSLSGDLGYFELSGKLPKKAKKSEGLHGRVCYTGGAQAAAAVDPDGSTITVHGTYVCDATNGTFNAYLSTSNTDVGSVHSGDASYGSFDVGGDCNVEIIDCATGPNP